MIETYYAGVYWLNRPESAQDCARRAESYFRLLAPLDPTWTHWFGQADTLEEALQLRIDPVAATFEALFTRKEHQMVKGGHSLYVWNGDPSLDGTTTNFSCGTSSRVVSNACVLSPPDPTRSPVGKRVVTASTMTQVLRAMAMAWEPDWGVAMSHSHSALLRQAGPLPEVRVGWVTYLSHRRGPIPPLPAPVRVEPVEDRGSLIILTSERFTADNPAHVELASQVRQQLEQAGLLTAPGR